METPQIFKRQEMIKVAKLADRWQCSRQHIYNMIDKGGLSAFRFGGKRCMCVPMSEVDRVELQSVIDSNS